MNEETLRLFLALTPPQEAKDSIAEIAATLQGEKLPFSFDAAEKYHVTIKFLGNVSRSKCEKLQDEIRKSAQQQASVTLNSQKLCTFPTVRLPHALVITFNVPDCLKKLKEKIDSNLATIGFPRDDRFIPHITLGKLRRGAGLQAPIDRAISANIQFTVHSIELYRSIFYEKGSRYEVLQTQSFEKGT